MKMLSFVLLIPSITLVFGFKLEKLENELLRHIDVEALQDVFKVHLFRNPHPKCSLQNEICEFDSNCCQGMECKMDVDRAGLKSICLSRYADPDEPPITVDDDDIEDAVGWSFNKHDPELTSNVEEEGDAIQASLKHIKEKEKQTLDNNMNLIQELRKPLTFEELNELTQLKELDDLKKQQELKQLKEWTKNHETNEMLKKRRQKVLEKIAKERVEQVLKEEEKQKLEIFKEMIQHSKGKQTQP